MHCFGIVSGLLYVAAGVVVAGGVIHHEYISIAQTAHCGEESCARGECLGRDVRDASFELPIVHRCPLCNS